MTILGPVRRHEYWLGFVLLAYLVVAATYNYNTPVFETPDEIFHYLYVRNLAAGQGLPRDVGRGSKEPAQEEAAQPPLYYAVAAALTFWAPRGNLDAIARPNPAGSLGDPRTDGNKNRYLHGPEETFPWHGEILTVHLVRFTTTLWGALAVFFTYLTGRRLFFNGWLAVSAAAVVAFTPEFLFMSSAVSNDVAVATAGAALLYVSTRVAREKPSTRGAIALGGAGGAVVMTKPIAGGALILVVVAIALSARDHHEAHRRSLERLAVAVAVTLVCAGWWFVYNLVTYGSLMPLQSFLSRSDLFAQMPSLASFVSDLHGLFLSYWAFFGWFSIPVPVLYYRYFEVLLALGLAGFIVGVLRARGVPSSYRKGMDPSAIVLPLGLFLTVLLGVFAYRLVVQDFHGRLLLGAVSGIALLLVYGWASLAPRFARPLVIGLLTTGTAVTAMLLPWTVLGPAYHPPPLVPLADAHPATPVDARFGDAIRLLGADVGPGNRLRPGEELSVTVYLQALRPPSADYMLFMKVVDPNGKVLADVNSFPGHGTYQTSLWSPGPVLVDRYQIQLPANAAAPSVDHIVFGFFQPDLQQDLPAFDGDGIAIGTSAQIGTIVVQGPTDQAQAGGGLEFREGDRNVVALLNHTVSSTIVSPGAALDGTLLFSAVARPSKDYTIFVHLERDGQLLAQDDAPPLQGAFPTSYWSSGDLVEHHWQIQIPPDAATGSYVLRIGWYDRKTGARLPTSFGDSVDLATIVVQ